jgi:hypothetical protein
VNVRVVQAGVWKRICILKRCLAAAAIVQNKLAYTHCVADEFVFVSLLGTPCMAGKSRVSHPYDGDGLVASVAFSDGKAYFRARLVRTPELDAEEAAGANACVRVSRMLLIVNPDCSVETMVRRMFLN